MKIILTLFCVSILLIIAPAFRPSENGLCDSPLIGDHTGAPGETNCTGCHPGTANSGTGTLDFNLGGTTTYVPGQIYNGTVILSQASLDKFGFVATALKNSNNTTAGTFAINDNVRTRLFSSGGRNYVSHTPCGADATTPGTINWNFTWQAPQTDVGEITIYISSLAANHSHGTSGDETYTSSILLSPSTTGIQETNSLQEITIYPVPSSDFITVNLESLSIRSADFTILNLAGQTVMKGNAKIIDHTFKIDIASLPSGAYFLNIFSANKSFISKFVSI